MSEIKKMKAKIKYKFRGGTAENWELLNPVLSAREPGLVTDESGKTIAFKIGDGVTAWNDLELHNINDGGSIDPTLLQKKLELWQPNTEYKVGDVVIAFYAPVTPSGILPVKLTFIATCMTAHISSGEFGLDLNTLDVWNVNIVNAYNALYDRLGNLIDETYATKEELQNGYATINHTHNGFVSKTTFDETIGDIETALDGIIAIQDSLIGGDS